MMTIQQAFDVIWHYALKGKKGFNAYRSELCSPCFVGLLIPDSKYRPEYEKCSATYLMHMYPGTIQVQDADSDRLHYFVKNMQEIHDMYQPESWLLLLRDAARLLRLKVPA